MHRPGSPRDRATPRPPRAPGRAAAALLLAGNLLAVTFAAAAPEPAPDSVNPAPPGDAGPGWSGWSRPGAPSDLGQLRRALAHPDGQAAALRILARPDAATLKAARNAGYGRLLAGLAADPQHPIAHRLRALRLTPLYQAPGPLLMVHLTVPAGAPGTDRTFAPADPAAVALAREAARALAALGRVDLLTEAAAHPDPEVRAFALGAGANPRLACAALGAEAPAVPRSGPAAPDPTAAAAPDPKAAAAPDPKAAAAPVGGPGAEPWPFVRRAAALGLGTGGREAGRCLALALVDPDPTVVEAAVSAAGQSGDADLRAPLRTLAAAPRGPVPVRAEAVVALARLGDFAPALRIAETHRTKGGIVPLTLGAVRALTVGKRPEHLKVVAALVLDSPEAAVRLGAAEALLLADPALGTRQLNTRLKATRDAAERRDLDALAARHQPAAPPDTRDEPTEDDEPD